MPRTSSERRPVEGLRWSRPETTEEIATTGEPNRNPRRTDEVDRNHTRLLRVLQSKTLGKDEVAERITTTIETNSRARAFESFGDESGAVRTNIKAEPKSAAGPRVSGRKGERAIRLILSPDKIISSYVGKHGPSVRCLLSGLSHRSIQCELPRPPLSLESDKEIVPSEFRIRKPALIAATHNDCVAEPFPTMSTI